MKIVEEFPPNYEKIKAHFDLTGRAPLFSYGETLYNPHKAQLRDDLIAHEEVHSKQQGSEPDVWWEKYISDEKFRLEQEVEAYAVQYDFIKQRAKEKTSRQFLDLFAEILSSPMYGGVVTLVKAKTLIRNSYKKLHEKA